MEEQSFNSQLTELNLTQFDCQRLSKNLSNHSTNKPTTADRKSPHQKQQQIRCKSKTDEGEFSLQQKKLSLESLKLVLAQLQQNMVKKCKSSQEMAVRHQTEVIDRSQLKNMTLSQLKKLKQGTLR